MNQHLTVGWIRLQAAVNLLLDQQEYAKDLDKLQTNLRVDIEQEELDPPHTAFTEDRHLNFN